MTAIRDRRSDPDAADDDPSIPWDERAAIGNRRGLPWWGAVLLALGLAAVGAIVDFQISDELGVLFQGCYLVVSVAAVVVVRRRNLFGPMVQPPLILAIIVPVVVLLGEELPSGSDTLAKALAIGTPLINAFPMMAITTGLTVALGILRIYRERDPDAPQKLRGKGKRPSDRAAADKQSGKPRRQDDDEEQPGRSRQPEGREAPRRGPAPGGPPAGAAGTGAGRRARPEDAARRPRERAPERDPAAPPAGPPSRDQQGRPRQRPPMPPGGGDRRRRPEDWPEGQPPGAKRPRGRPAPDDAPPPRRPRGGRGDQGPGGRPPRRARPWEE